MTTMAAQAGQGDRLIEINRTHTVYLLLKTVGRECRINNWSILLTDPGQLISLQ